MTVDEETMLSLTVGESPLRNIYNGQEPSNCHSEWLGVAQRGLRRFTSGLLWRTSCMIGAEATRSGPSRNRPIRTRDVFRQCLSANRKPRARHATAKYFLPLPTAFVILLQVEYPRNHYPIRQLYALLSSVILKSSI